MPENKTEDTTPVEATPVEEITITPDGVLAKLREAASADPFATDRKSAAIRSAGVALADIISREKSARALADTLSRNAVSQAEKALLVLAENTGNAATATAGTTTAPTGDQPRRRGRPPGSSNKPASDTPSAPVNGAAATLSD